MPLAKRALFLPKECLRQKVFFEDFWQKPSKTGHKSYPPAGGPRFQKFFTLLWPTLTKKGGFLYVNAIP
jgi:hypothetical protein